MDARCVNDSTLSSTKPAASSKGKMFSLGGFSTRQNLQRTLIEEIQNQFGLSAEAAGDGDVINDVFTLSADSARSLPVEILSRDTHHGRIPMETETGEARFLEIGKYWEISAMELLARLNTKTTPMSLLDIYLLQPH
jgi:hypothetical protein